MKPFIAVAIILCVAACTPIDAPQAPSYNESCVTVEAFEVRGESMRPAYAPGENITALIGYHKCNNLTRGMTVLYKFSARDTPLLKHVIAAASDTFELRQNGTAHNLYVNGELQRTTTGTPYRFAGKKYERLRRYEEDYGDGLEPGILLILGNEATGSLDSSRFGLVNERQVLGIVKE